MRQNASFGDLFFTIIADVVGFLRDHALPRLPQDRHSFIIGDRWLSRASRFYRYFAWSRPNGPQDSPNGVQKDRYLEAFVCGSNKWLQMGYRIPQMGSKNTDISWHLLWKPQIAPNGLPGSTKRGPLCVCDGLKIGWKCKTILRLGWRYKPA